MNDSHFLQEDHISPGVFKLILHSPMTQVDLKKLCETPAQVSHGKKIPGRILPMKYWLFNDGIIWDPYVQ